MTKKSHKDDLTRMIKRSGAIPDAHEKHEPLHRRAGRNAMRIGAVLLVGITGAMTQQAISDEGSPGAGHGGPRNAEAGQTSPEIPNTPDDGYLGPNTRDLPSIPADEHVPNLPTVPPVNERPSLKQ